METIDILKQLQDDISHLKKNILINSVALSVSEKWIPRSRVMEFLDYGSTQMCELEKSGGLIVSKIGKRTFIHKDSLELLLNKGKIAS